MALVKRMVVVGTSGAGKTTFAAALARWLQVPHVEIDALYWFLPGWQPPPPAEFRARVARALAGQTWVADGNYSAVRDLTWGRADTLVWLDYPLPLVLWRLVCRTARRVMRRETLWGTQREDLRVHFGKDSLVLYAVKTHHARRRRFDRLLAAGAFAHLHVYRLRSPREAARWLSALRRDDHLTGISTSVRYRDWSGTSSGPTR
jgi:adenylate kinase family enzyme